MKTYHFKGILQNTGWKEHTGVTVNNEGIITDISSFDPQHTSNKIIDGFAIPGFQNAHSHAFQYAMAGLAERHENTTSTPDDFWGWREAMYQLALTMNPEQMEAIATMLYAEMARHGYTNVAEFHYVHHDKNGVPYANLSEMGNSLISAAKNAGIGITLIPIFYQKGGFGKEPNDRQRRFISPTIDKYLTLLESSKAACKHYQYANIAIGIHSMRGVEPSDIAEIAKSGPQGIPFHIHVSEQLKEIEDSVKYLGKRPVEWLLDHVDMNDRFHLVHATHLTDNEIEGIAKSKANVVLCPSTEGNLGDGLFPLRKYQENGGKWSIGTDSHVGLNPLEELRILDYGQRLISHKRNTYSSHQQGDSGMYAIEMATKTGRKAMNNFTADFFKVGEPLNACIIDASSPLLATTATQNLASTIVYATDSNMQLGTIANGEMIVANQNHIKYHEIKEKFAKTIDALKNR
ncbi:formimidoylglutamate deiminase [Aquimarina sp. EL_43]|uniref:formimidoylglutamate deiminase n=1 Tax=unclassified Aquimarina TaxID=2627091 RepID=UPI0018C9F8B6|nr:MULTISPECIES: formimidoylglutamate deiminase [unclassified Aquimarina]MBG6130853.1 formimidoylglutamate deiminase [Aquimarina sp. EL_35]MBG6151000.1 formimidoylglutamate deiminase [Aquimarina sp. EL_32]MBG6169243.1 formimidoylglutamate deiminase [Aquimarina sp. EL_43]